MNGSSTRQGLVPVGGAAREEIRIALTAGLPAFELPLIPVGWHPSDLPGYAIILVRVPALAGCATGAFHDPLIRRSAFRAASIFRGPGLDAGRRQQVRECCEVKLRAALRVDDERQRILTL